MHLWIAPDGMLRGLYEELLDWRTLGRLTITRASHVEPRNDGTWEADLAPCDGPCLGPYPTRSVALNAERTWLEQNPDHWAKLGNPRTAPEPSPVTPKEELTDE